MNTNIESVQLETTQPEETKAFLDAAFGLGDVVGARASDAPTSGFRGYTLSLVVAQPSTVDSLFDSAVQAGATVVKPAKKSFWGYGASLRSPDGTVWTLASSSKKDTGPATREVDEVVLLMGVEDVKGAKEFYSERGLAVGKSFGSKYVEFDMPGSAVKLALQSRRAVAKNAGVDADGSGSHRLTIVTGAASFEGPDGYVWESSAQ